MIKEPTILVFDFGLGGSTVFREVAAARPDARFVYLADDAAFPYGDMAEDNAHRARPATCIGEAIAEHEPDLVVIACNTASTLALTDLRARFEVPFVGTVPAIKPACAQSQSKRIAVLGTQATVSREYTTRADPRIRSRLRGGAGRLAAAGRLRRGRVRRRAGRPTPRSRPRSRPASSSADGRRTDTVVLACTHYPLLLDPLQGAAPWPVDWLDPAPAIARRVADLLRDRPAGAGPAAAAGNRLHLRPRPSPTLAAALAGYGFKPRPASRFDRAALTP